MRRRPLIYRPEPARLWPANGRLGGQRSGEKNLSVSTFDPGGRGTTDIASSGAKMESGDSDRSESSIGAEAGARTFTSHVLKTDSKWSIRMCRHRKSVFCVGSGGG